MFHIDREHYGRAWVDREFMRIDRKPAFRRPLGKLYAVCHREPLYMLLLVLYLREQGSGVLLMHQDTPYGKAVETARQAGADYLSYGDIEHLEPLEAGAGRRHVPALYQFSSGTTGEPKLICRTWEAIDREIAAYNERLMAERIGKPLLLVPISHSFGLISGTLSAIARGAEPHVIHDRNPKYALSLIRQTPEHLLYAVPFQLHLMQTLGKDGLRLHHLVSSGAPLTEALLGRLRSCAANVWQQYGCSELGCVSIGEALERPTDVGKPLEHLRVSCLPLETQSGEPLQEIVAEADGFTVHTRDIGYFDGRGALHVAGRADDLINVSGLKVLPSEVEAVIGRMEGVMEVVACRTRHTLWGEAVKVFIAASGDIRDQEVKAWCIRHLPKYKVPSVIRFVKEIPKMPSGKVSRRALQELEE
jgi:fatty-acyl-CoA synthase